MTTHKARKRAVRSRMSKTGESYSAARSHVVKPSQLPPRAGEPQVSEAAVRRATGRGWDDWFRILDTRGIEGFSHSGTAAWLASEHGVPPWWTQSVTVGYERARGLRQVHEVSDGFSVGVTRTYPVGLERLRLAFTDDAELARWLDLGRFTARSTTPGRTARFDDHADGSRVSAYFTAKADSKSSVAVQHERLGDAEAVENARTFWRERLSALGVILVEGG
ncbi:hypothetical protein BH23CHL8_BH23CHL8_05890 [soil metagenome]